MIVIVESNVGIIYLEYLSIWKGELPEFVTDGSSILVQP